METWALEDEAAMQAMLKRRARVSRGTEAKRGLTVDDAISSVGSLRLTGQVVRLSLTSKNWQPSWAWEFSWDASALPIHIIKRLPSRCRVCESMGE